MKFRFVLPLSDTDLQALIATYSMEKSQPCVAVPMPSC